MSARRTGREFALQLLYARDNDREADVGSDAMPWSVDFELELPADAVAFARAIVDAARDRAAKIDELIAAS